MATLSLNTLQVTDALKDVAQFVAVQGVLSLGKHAVNTLADKKARGGVKAEQALNYDT